MPATLGNESSLVFDHFSHKLSFLLFQKKNKKKIVFFLNFFKKKVRVGRVTGSKQFLFLGLIILK